MGPAGPAGPGGPAGPSDVYVARRSNDLVLDHGDVGVQVLGLSLAAGNYFATASIQASRDLVEIPILHCRLDVSGTTEFVQEVGRAPMTFAFSEAFALSEATDVLLTCDQLGTGAPGQGIIEAATLIAIRVATVAAQ